MPGHLRAAPRGLLADLHEVHGVLPHAVASLGHRGQPRLLAGHGQGGLRPPGRHPEGLVSLWWSPWSPCPHDSGWCLTPITAPESELTVLLARTHSALATLTHSPPLRHQNQFPGHSPPPPVHHPGPDARQCQCTRSLQSPAQAVTRKRRREKPSQPGWSGSSVDAAPRDGGSAVWGAHDGGFYCIIALSWDASKCQHRVTGVDVSCHVCHVSRLDTCHVTHVTSVCVLCPISPQICSNGNLSNLIEKKRFNWHKILLI